MTSSTLKSFVDRIENLDAEQKEIGADKRTVFDEAADAGFDKKAIRRLLRDRREAAKDKGTAELAEQYKMLLSEPGATYRSVAEKTGAKKSTLHRLVPKSERGTDHNPETGEITKTADLRNTPAGDDIEALTPDGQDAVAGNPIEDAAGRSPGQQGGSHDAGLTPEPEVARVVPPVPDLRYDPYEEAPPPFLDQRHKARATG